MTPLQFIKSLEGLPFDQQDCNNGYCYRFALLLSKLFPGGTLEWDYFGDQHVVYRWKDNKLYDAKGILANPKNYRIMTVVEMNKASRWGKHDLGDDNDRSTESC